MNGPDTPPWFPETDADWLARACEFSIDHLASVDGSGTSVVYVLRTRDPGSFPSENVAWNVEKRMSETNRSSRLLSDSSRFITFYELALTSCAAIAFETRDDAIRAYTSWRKENVSTDWKGTAEQ